MKARFCMAFAIAILSMICVPLVGASLITVNFDNFSTTCCSGGAPISNTADTWMTFGTMRINGGTVIADTNATSAPNVYAAAIQPNNTGLVDHVEMVFSTPAADISFDVVNGGAASSFAAYAFDSKGNPIGVQIVNLNCASCTGAVGHVSFNFGGISEVVVRNNPAIGVAAFAVDTVRFDPASPVSEPAGMALLGSGVIGLWSVRKRSFSR